MNLLAICGLRLRRWRLERNFRQLTKGFQRLRADEIRQGKPESVRPQSVRSLRQFVQTKRAVQEEIDRIDAFLVATRRAG
jgi:hypothetical protein